MHMPELKLRDGNKVPLVSIHLIFSPAFTLTSKQLAFGTGTASFKEPCDAAYFNPGLVKIIQATLEVGFRHIDCAEMYNNEEEVGIALKQSGIPRSELFITTKVAYGIKDIPAAINQSLRKLQMDYVDL